MKFVGKSHPIHDAKNKASGSLKYVADVMLPRMAHICLIYSNIPHGYVKSVNAAAALSVDGVIGVFHCFNTSSRKYNRYRSQFSQELPDEERAFHRYVRFVGDRVAAVVARDLETARRAAVLVQIEYEEIPYAVTIEDALAGKSVLPGENPVRDEFTATLGTPRSGGVCVETELDFPRLHHATMETHACIADYDPYQDKLTVYSPNQSVFGIRTMLADYLEMPYQHIRVIKAPMGGSFGGKQEWFTEPVAALIAKELKRPVKLCFSRSEAMASAYVRAPMKSRMVTRFSPDGTLQSLDLDVLADAGAYMGNTKDYMRTLYGKLFRCYRVPYAHYRARIVSSNTPVSGAYRSWSAAEEAMMMEHNLNVAALRLGMDPIELRLKNVLLTGDMDEKSGLPLEEIRIREAILRGRELFDWDGKKAADEKFNAGSERRQRGVGIGCGGHGNTYFPRHNDFACASLSMNEDGSICASMTLHDHGCGTITAMQAIIAEALDITPDLIELREGDTSATPFDYGCYASRTTFVNGRAAQEAAKALLQELYSATSLLWHIPKEDLYAENGCVYSRNDESFSRTYREISQHSLTELRRIIQATASFTETSNPGVTGAHFAHVEVDTYTGFVRILDYLAVHDIGQPINPAMCVAQIQGAVQMGCGAALREKLTVNAQGRPLDSLSKYHVFLATDLPDIQVELITDGTSKEGPYGAKSIGEVSFVPVAPAICGAVNQALKSEIGHLPLDPDRILSYLSKERNKP